MKVLSLMQPWASLLFWINPDTGKPLKDWETRSWKPSLSTIADLQREGFLIHASKAIGTREQRECYLWLHENGYSDFVNSTKPFGAIIGRVTLGRVFTTDNYASKIHTINDRSNYALGDYRSGRYAWEILNPIPLPANRIYQCSGQLNLWTFPGCIKTKGTPELLLYNTQRLA